MGEFKVIVKGVKELEESLLKRYEMIDHAGERIVRRAGEAVARNSKLVFLGRPTVIKTKNKGARREGLPYLNNRSQSWPTPTNRTGHLRDSIHVGDITRLGPGRWISTTGPTMVYGRRVELGGVSRTNGTTIRTRPFPYMTPGFERSRTEITTIYREEWARALR